MYFIKRKILRIIYKILRKNPNDLPMVKYWKKQISIPAKVMSPKGGATVMAMEGEDELFPGFPRQHSLFGKLSKMKHEIKNQIFNEAYGLIESGRKEEAIALIKGKVTGGLSMYLEDLRYDMIPPEKMVPAVKELWRAFSVLEIEEPRLRWLKEALTFVLQEDDAYRFRFQWMVSVFRPYFWLSRNPIKDLGIALDELKGGEVVADMKDKVHLLKTIFLLVLEDEYIYSLFLKLYKEIDWKKCELSKADKYHFRGKWFKVDLLLFEY